MDYNNVKTIMITSTRSFISVGVCIVSLCCRVLALLEACDVEDETAICQTITSITANRFDADLAAEISAANKRLEWMRRWKGELDISTLDDTIRAVGALNRPHNTSVHLLVQALLLLHGVDESETMVREERQEGKKAMGFRPHGSFPGCRFPLVFKPWIPG